MPKGRRSVSAGWAGICFDAACQSAQDVAFLQALSVPGAVAVGVAFLLATDADEDSPSTSAGAGGRRPPKGLERDRMTRVNPPLVDESVALALSQGGRAVDGELADEAWAELQGMVKVKVKLGRVGFTLEEKPFYFARTLGDASEIFAFTCDRPLGIMFAEEEGTGRPVVESVAPDGNAGARSRALALTQGDFSTSVREGDVLRGFSCPRFTMDSTAQALVGDLGGAKRMLVLFDTDGQKFNKSMDALASGLRRDGPVRLVLERRTNAA